MTASIRSEMNYPCHTERSGIVGASLKSLAGYKREKG